MEQVAHPKLIKSHHPVVCTEEQAEAAIGMSYEDDLAWRIIEMRFVRKEITIHPADGEK